FGGGGVQRTVKFVKYLPEVGWQPVVLTVRQDYAQVQDHSFGNDIPAGTPIWRTRALLLPRLLPWRLKNLITSWLLLVDQQLGWLPFAVRQGLALARHQQVDAIYTTASPYTAHLVGLQLKRRTGLPWLADFRDPWLGNFAHSFPTSLHERWAGRLERQVVETADRVIVVSEPMREALLARYANLSPHRVLTLPNGYDPADMEGVEPLGHDPERMVIVYSGSFYGKQQTPFCFLQGLKDAIAAGHLPAGRVRVLFVGAMNRDIRQQVESMDLGGSIQVTGYVAHTQSVGYLHGADLLLLVVGSGPGSQAVLTGKIFEYLAAGKPILALAPPGAAANLVREARAGVVVDPEDVGAISAQIALCYRDWERGVLGVTSVPQVVARYDRRQLTATLARSLDCATAPGA
ncbi:MAG TPA: glycosyltransferase family 4 protein, partial [Anaerolineae bacterium]|nr:glycosyltransferase family 4 protein [Anaerolineae bacterium]